MKPISLVRCGLIAAACVAYASVACAGAMAPPPAQGGSLLLDSIGRLGAPTSAAFVGATGQDALDALRRGRWVRACAISSAVLARQVRDPEALGIFALCSAVTGDRSSAGTALERLQEAETRPYFALLTQGVLQLLDQHPEQAQAIWRPILQAQRDDPLALYFEGEAQYARKQTQPAVASFRSVLKVWPDFAPALTAVARLTAGPQASPQDLRAALALAEHATRLEPMNQGYWRLLADLCRRTGQDARAEAISLQYLRSPLPAAR